MKNKELRIQSFFCKPSFIPQLPFLFPNSHGFKQDLQTYNFWVGRDLKGHPVKARPALPCHSSPSCPHEGDLAPRAHPGGSQGALCLAGGITKCQAPSGHGQPGDNAGFNPKHRPGGQRGSLGLAGVILAAVGPSERCCVGAAPLPSAIL